MNLFTEDHAFVTGQRKVEISESLQPERSYNGSLNFNQIYTIGKSQGSLDVDGFYTYFTNKIIPNYNEPQKIIYANTQGHAISKGIGISMNHHFVFPLSFNLGINYQQVEEVSINEDGRKSVHPLAYAPKWSGVGSANYEWQKPKLTLAYTMRYTGAMALPEVFDLDDTGNPLPVARPTVSMPFSFHNLQITKAFCKNTWQVYAGLQNILNYRQPISPLVGYNDPNAAKGFSPFFDTAYAYSPLHGRELYVGVRWRARD
ncbi:MAG: TonB-dependent receptor [Saprospiraceae bacterium]|nr:TonB-dependent receptor [Saprospiraceae bacterium]